jgi:hypothetical protein
VSGEGEGAVKGDPKKARGGVEGERGTEKRERGLKGRLVRVEREERPLAFGHIQRETPVNGPGGNGIEGGLNGRGGSRDRGVRRPDREVIRIKGARNRGRQTRREVVDEEKEENWAKDGALRNALAKAKGRADALAEAHPRATVGQESPDPANKEGRQPKREELEEECRVPNGVKRLREIDGGEDSPLGRLREVETVEDGLREADNLVHSGMARAETRLKPREEIMGLEEMEEASENHALKELREAGGESDGTIGGRGARRLARLQKRDDGDLPGEGKEEDTQERLKMWRRKGRID